jgi:hypothetical protein
MMTDEQFHEMRSRADETADNLKEVSQADRPRPGGWGLAEAQDALARWDALEGLLRAYVGAAGR